MALGLKWPGKKDPKDFVLWKPSTASQPGWDSPWGVDGPVGISNALPWSKNILGDTIDIHGGGSDPYLSASRKRSRPESLRQRQSRLREVLAAQWHAESRLGKNVQVRR